MNPHSEFVRFVHDVAPERKLAGELAERLGPMLNQIRETDGRELVRSAMNTLILALDQAAKLREY
jgi:hypothetical protein